VGRERRIFPSFSVFLLHFAQSACHLSRNFLEGDYTYSARNLCYNEIKKAKASIKITYQVKPRPKRARFAPSALLMPWERILKWQKEE